MDAVIGIYAAGLYDYLPQPVAIRLTSLLFDALRSGGVLLFGNFRPETEAIGYMESFMRWRLLYRTERELEAIAASLPRSAVGARRVFDDEDGNVVYAELTRA